MGGLAAAFPAARRRLTTFDTRVVMYVKAAARLVPPGIWTQGFVSAWSPFAARVTAANTAKMTMAMDTITMAIDTAACRKRRIMLSVRSRSPVVAWMRSRTPIKRSGRARCGSSSGDGGTAVLSYVCKA